MTWSKNYVAIDLIHFHFSVAALCNNFFVERTMELSSSCVLQLFLSLFQHCVLALTDYRTTKLETSNLKTEKMCQKLFTNIISRELPSTETSNPDESISKLGIILEKLNKSKMMLFNTKNILDKKNTVDTVFNVQHDKLNSQFIKSQSCCLTRKTCPCLGQNSVNGRQIKNILGGEGHRRLKIFVRI